jgi:hypothetical protein
MIDIFWQVLGYSENLFYVYCGCHLVVMMLQLKDQFVPKPRITKKLIGGKIELHLSSDFSS